MVMPEVRGAFFTKRGCGWAMESCGNLGAWAAACHSNQQCPQAMREWAGRHVDALLDDVDGSAAAAATAASEVDESENADGKWLNEMNGHENAEADVKTTLTSTDSDSDPDSAATSLLQSQSQS